MTLYLVLQITNVFQSAILNVSFLHFVIVPLKTDQEVSLSLIHRLTTLQI